MEAIKGKLYSELRITRKELIERLDDVNGSALIKPILREELMDIEKAIQKIELGDYGKCEVSGELIPDDLLRMFPTIESLEDMTKLEQFYRKPLFT